MPRTVKLTSADARAWRENRAQWVNPKGYVLRAVTPEEEKAVFPALKRVEQFKQSGKCNVEAVYKVQDPATNQLVEQRVPMEVVVRVTKTGRDANAFLYDLFVNGNRYVKGRDVLRSRILEKHGECILQGPNGKQICVLRDPRVNRPTFGESQRSAPSPDRCHCRGFKDNPEIGRHHAACEWNMKAPPHERALPVNHEYQDRGMLGMVTPIAGMSFLPPEASGAPVMPSPQVLRSSDGRQLAGVNPSYAQQGGVAAMSGPVVMSGPSSTPSSVPYAQPPAPPGMASDGMSVALAPVPTVATRLEAPLVSPDKCENDCRGIASGTKGWAWPPQRRPEPNQHHPLCKHEAAWRTHVSGRKRWMLYDLDRKVELREATVDERARADVELQRNGIRAVTVGDRIYAVVEEGGTPAATRGAVAPSGASSLAGLHVRNSPHQDALRTAPSESVAGPARVVSRPGLPAASAAAAKAEPSIEDLERELARRKALAASVLPSVPVDLPGPPPGADLAAFPEDESGEPVAGEPSWGDVAEIGEAQPDPGLPVEEPEAHAFGEASGLRNELGLVGLQQHDGSIEKGPVVVHDPEPFVDPLEDGPEVQLLPRGSVAQAVGVGATG